MAQSSGPPHRLEPPGDPLVRRTHAVQYNGSAHSDANSFAVNITSIGAEIHGITDDDQVLVEVYEDGIWIQPLDPDDIP